MEDWTGEAFRRKACRVEEPRQWEGYFDAGLKYEAVSHSHGSAKAEIVIDLAFTRERVPVGRQWMSIACSGAWLDLSTTTGCFEGATKSVERTGTQRVRRGRNSSVNAKHDSFEYTNAQSD